MISPRGAGPRVLLLAGGGLSHVSGGVGSLMRYMIEAWAPRPDAPRMQVVDTRGGGGVLGGVGVFAGALTTVIATCLTRRADVVHAHMTTRGSAIRKSLLCGIAYLAMLPVIVHMHGADFFEYYHRQARPVRWALRSVLQRASYVVVLGTGWRDFLAGLGAPQDRIIIILNGVKAPAVPRTPKIPGAIPHIAFLGRLGERKGVPELIVALGSAEMQARSWTATIAGDGDVERFRAEVQQAALADRVELPGWLDRSAASALLSGAAMLVLPSHHEVMPIAILEALAHQTAVIATPVGANPEFLVDDHNALLVPVADPARLAAAMCRLLDEPQTRDRLAEAGHALFLRDLDIHKVADIMLGLYETAMRPRAKPAALKVAARTSPGRL